MNQTSSSRRRRRSLMLWLNRYRADRYRRAPRADRRQPAMRRWQCSCARKLGETDFFVHIVLRWFLISEAFSCASRIRRILKLRVAPRSRVMGKILICEPIRAGGGIRVSPRQNFARIFLPCPGRKNSTVTYARSSSCNQKGDLGRQARKQRDTALADQ